MSLVLLLGPPEHRVVVRVVYSDESGMDKGDVQPITVVAAIMLNMDCHWHPVREAIEKAIMDVLDKTQDDLTHYEIKTASLFHQIKKGHDKAGELLHRLVEIPQKQAFPIFQGIVEKVEIADALKKSELQIDLSTLCFREALRECLVAANRYVRAGYQNEQILWIHDSGGAYNEHGKDQLRSLRWIHDEANLKKLLPEHRYISPDMTAFNIADMMYFGDSKESRALQMADVCAVTIARFHRDDFREIAKPFYQILEPAIVNSTLVPRIKLQQLKGKP